MKGWTIELDPGDFARAKSSKSHRYVLRITHPALTSYLTMHASVTDGSAAGIIVPDHCCGAQSGEFADWIYCNDCRIIRGGGIEVQVHAFGPVLAGIVRDEIMPLEAELWLAEARDYLVRVEREYRRLVRDADAATMLAALRSL